MVPQWTVYVVAILGAIQIYRILTKTNAKLRRIEKRGEEIGIPPRPLWKVWKDILS